MNTTLDEDESSLNSEPWMDPDISKQNAGRAIRPPSCSFMLIESREWWRAMFDERRVIKGFHRITFHRMIGKMIYVERSDYISQTRF